MNSTKGAKAQQVILIEAGPVGLAAGAELKQCGMGHQDCPHKVRRGTRSYAQVYAGEERVLPGQEERGHRKRAPTFLLATGYEQVRSIVAFLDGYLEAAEEVRLELPESGSCVTRQV